MKNVIEVTPYGVFLHTPPIAQPWRWHGSISELLCVLVAHPTLSMLTQDTAIHVRETSKLFPDYLKEGGYDATR